MLKNKALIFGFNKYACEIVENIHNQYEEIKLYSLNEEDKENSEYDIEHFDLSDKWDILKGKLDNAIAFCVLEDTAENIFLTISLRANYPDLTIVALASQKESANKLSMAGANKVIPLIETTANIITNILENPISSSVLHSILYSESDLKIAQIKIDKNSHINNEELSCIDWSHYHGVIVLSVMHKNMKSEFIYSSRAKHHVVSEGDILVVVGYETDITEFEKKIGSKRYVSWSDWSW